MLRYTLVALLCLLGVTNGVFGDIYVWEGEAENCTIDHVNNTIQINVAGTYGFRAWNPETEELEDIQNITIDSGVTGPVTVMIAYDEAGDNGAVNLRQGNLTVDGQEVYLAGLEIYGSGVTPVQGDIHVTNSYSGTLLIDHKFAGEIDLDSDLTGTISITAVTTGLVNVDDNVSGTILIDANLNKPGRILIGDNVTQSDATVPAIRITGGAVGVCREGARRRGCIQRERFLFSNQVFTRCRGVRRVL